MKVEEIMFKHLYKVANDKRVVDVVKTMDKHNIGSVLVEKDDKIVGIMTERDVLRKVVARARDPKDVLVGDIMTTPLITVDVGTRIQDAAEIMTDKQIKRLLVAQNKEIVGVVSVRTITKNLRNIYDRMVVNTYSK